MSLDADLRARAAKVIPGGMYGHLNAALHGDTYPQFFTWPKAPASGTPTAGSTST